jgi:hypothetical protein
MPNGKGSLECCYCIHWRGEWQGYDGAYEAGFCDQHKVKIPSTLEHWGHRVCHDFSPNKSFEKDSPISVEERFSWFTTELKHGILYEFNYSSPREVKELMDLRRKE